MFLKQWDILGERRHDEQHPKMLEHFWAYYWASSRFPELAQKVALFLGQNS